MTNPRHPRAAFSIIELLISLVIISILTSMVILIASQRAEEARLETARADLRLIAAAQQQAVIDTGYFLRLYVLDDLTGGSDGFNPPDDFDYLQDEQFNNRNPDGNIFGIRPDYGALPTAQVTDEPGQLLDITALVTDEPGQLLDITALVRNESILGIGLPYISYPRQWEDPTTGENYNVPSDPWGMPYVIMTRQGFINDVDVLFSPAQGLIDTSVGIVGTSLTIPALIFDRMTLLSFGPNALPGDGSGTTATLQDPGNFGKADDLILQLN